MNKNCYRLCGGIFFFLFLQSCKPRIKQNEILVSLIKTLYLNYHEPNLVNEKNSFSKTVSEYKSCKTNGGSYIPFNETETLLGIKKHIKENYHTALKKMGTVVSKYLDVSGNNAELLIRQLIEMIVFDNSITDGQEFFVLPDGQPMTKAQISECCSFCLESFLLGVWYFSVTRNNIEGKNTYDEICPDTAERNNKGRQRIYVGNLGLSIDKTIEISRNISEEVSVFGLNFEATPRQSVNTEEKKHESLFNEKQGQYLLPMSIQLTSKFFELISKYDHSRLSLKNTAAIWRMQSDTRILFIKGAHGTGKSHFVASLQRESPYSSFVFFDHTYCSLLKNDLIGIVSKHIACQFSECNKEYRDNLERFVSVNKNALDSTNTEKSLYLRLICEPMNGIKEPFILLVDAMDESYNCVELNNFIVSIVKTCPNIKLIITSTDDINFGGVPFEKVSLDKCKDDVKSYIEEKAKSAGFTSEETQNLIACADGNFKFAEFAIDNKIKDYSEFSEKTDFDCLYRCYFERLDLENPNRISEDLKLIFALIIHHMNSIKDIIEICGETNWNKFYSLFHGFVTIRDGYAYLWHFSVYSYVRKFLSNDNIEKAKNKCEEFLFNTIGDIEKVTARNSPEIIESYEFLRRIDRTSKINRNLKCLYNIQCAAYKMSKIPLSLEMRNYIEKKKKVGVIRDNLSYDIYVCSTITHFETCCENGEYEKAHCVLQELSSELNFDKMTLSTELYVKFNYCWDTPSRDKLDQLEKELGKAENLSTADYDYYRAFCRYLSAKLYYADGDYQNCINDCDMAIGIAEETWIDDVESFCSLLCNQKGWSYFHLQNYAEALRLFKESHEKRLEVYGKYSRYTALSKDALVRVMIRIAEIENQPIDSEAFTLANEALEINKALFGETSPKTARSYMTQASLFNFNLNFTSAIEYLEKAKSIYNATSADYATCCQLLGDTLLKKDSCNEETLKKAHSLYTECYDIRKMLNSHYLSETKTALLNVEERLKQTQN